MMGRGTSLNRDARALRALRALLALLIAALILLASAAAAEANTISVNTTLDAGLSDTGCSGAHRETARCGRRSTRHSQETLSRFQGLRTIEQSSR